MIGLQPLANVNWDESTGQWLAHNDDPQFLVAGIPEAGLEKGFYRFTVQIGADKPVTDPILYPDYGDGYSPDTQITLPMPNAAGLIDAWIVLPARIVSMRFDPTNRKSVLDVRDARLKPAGKLWVIGATAKAISSRRGTPLWKAWTQVVVRAVHLTLQSGAREAGKDVVSLYQRNIAPPGGGYEYWFDQYARGASMPEREKRLGRLSQRPLISILLPTYNTPVKWLELAIESIRAQSYPKWELCIADDASREPGVRMLLDKYQRLDERIRVEYRGVNGHISKCSNTALDMARGEYVALMDHDDELAQDALLEVVEMVVRDPGLKVIYSDEDKIDESGRHYDPYLKPDFNRELLLAQNCICHFGVYRADLVRDIGGFRPGYEGAQDWDLALRATARLSDAEVGHVPKVLYHWRSIRGSTARDAGQKSYAAQSGLRAVRDHLQCIGIQAEARVDEAGYISVRRSLPIMPRVSIVVPTKDKAGLLEVCVNSIIERTQYSDYEIIVIDNGSVESVTHALFDKWKAERRIKVVDYDHPFNYSRINNFGFEQASGDIYCLMNNDIEVITPGWLDEMVSHAVRSDVGAVGAMLYYPNDTIQHAGVVIGIGGVAGHAYVGMPRGYPGQMGRARLTQEVSAVTAACMVVRREVMEEVGGLDEGLKVAFNDIDLCLRIKALGYRVIWTPHAELYHHESASRGYEDTPEKQARFKKEVDFMKARWGDALERDPFYNPNLTLTAEPYGLSYPPRL